MPTVTPSVPGTGLGADDFSQQTPLSLNCLSSTKRAHVLHPIFQ